MPRINAAVVTDFAEPPRYHAVRPAGVERPGSDPGGRCRRRLAPEGPDRSAPVRTTRAAGKLPMIPGIDGVGRRADGRLVYFAADDAVLGTMAERALVDPRRTIVLPDDVDAAKVAAAMNPAMSSWVALRRRVPLQPGQIRAGPGRHRQRRHRGRSDRAAGSVPARVVGAGRNAERLAAVVAAGADATVQLTGDADATGAALAGAAAEVDIVIDYLWGEPAQRAMLALLTKRSDRSRALDWIQIGAVAGATLELPSAALRSNNLRLQGSGQGSVSPDDYLAELPSLVSELQTGLNFVKPHPRPLAEVERAWLEPEPPGERTVLIA